jgi:hypothetical protein
MERDGEKGLHHILTSIPQIFGRQHHAKAWVLFPFFTQDVAALGKAPVTCEE